MSVDSAIRKTQGNLVQGNKTAARERILVISHVLPFPADSGQQQRVLHTLTALRARFHVTVVTCASAASAAVITEKLLKHCDNVVILPQEFDRGVLAGIGGRIKGAVYCAWSCEKRSNYVIGRQQFSPSRLESLARLGHYDCVLYEYWHANQSTKVFRSRGIPVVLDMHNILWKARDEQLAARRWLPSWIRHLLVARYRQREERAWRRFDAVIAINEAERRYTTSRLSANARVFYAPMGLALEKWLCAWQPVQPPRIAYYGFLGSPHNQRSAIECAQKVMPMVWRQFPNAELWLVGSNPSDEMKALAGPRVKVTGFVENAPAVLRTMSVVLCPWQGTYGFRSRIVEVMSLGVPIIASPDAVYGMDLEAGRGLLLASTPEQMASTALTLLREPECAHQHSVAAREQIHRRFDFGQTYGRLALELEQWVEKRRTGS